MQHLDHDEVSLHVDASAEALYAIVSDITRMPELSPEVVEATWLGGAAGPSVGARFVAVNSTGTGRAWRNRPEVVVADPGREFAFVRTEPLAGSIRWSYRFELDGAGTLVTESYDVERPVSRVGWWLIEHLYGGRDRRGALRAGMDATLHRLREVAQEPAQR